MIKYEFEANNELRDLFPDIIWSNCERDSPKWSEDDGLVLKRRTNPREATVEAHGLVDGMPTGKHFFLMVYDDVVTEKSVTSPDMIKKTTQAWELSRALGTEGGRTRYIGTRYHYFDTYYDLIKRKAGEVRMYPATKNGRFDGKPVLWTKPFLDQRVREMGPYVAACQLMQDPAADSAQGFQVEWLKYHDIDQLNGWHACKRMNRYLLVDPANEKKKTSDRTAMAVICLGEDGNYYLTDFIWDRLNLDERTDALFYLHKLWRPKKTGYERYGKDSDIDHIRYVQSEEN